MLTKKAKKQLEKLDRFNWKAILGNEPYIFSSIHYSGLQELQVCLGEDYLSISEALEALETLTEVLKSLQRMTDDQ